MDDLEHYKAHWTKPITADINNMLAFGLPAPASTSLVFFVMNLMEGYKLTPDDLKTTDAAVLMYHRLIESYKSGYAISSHLADPTFSNVSRVSEPE